MSIFCNLGRRRTKDQGDPSTRSSPTPKGICRISPEGTPIAFFARRVRWYYSGVEEQSYERAQNFTLKGKLAG